MKSLYNTLWLVITAAMLFSAVSCRNDRPQEPAIPFSVVGCRQISEIDSAHDRNSIHYTYDDQGRVNQIIRNEWVTGSQYVQHPTTVTYEGNDIYMTTPELPNRREATITRLIFEAGKLKYSISGANRNRLNDTAYFLYNNLRQLVGLNSKYYYGDSTLRFQKYEFNYVGSDITSTKYTLSDSQGRVHEYMESTSTYGARNTGYNPMSQFSYFPGVIIFKSDREVIRQSGYREQNYNGNVYRTELEDTYTYQRDSRGNVTQVNIRSQSGNEVHLFVKRYTYQCN